jgi:hypothetical protein
MTRGFRLVMAITIMGAFAGEVRAGCFPNGFSTGSAGAQLQLDDSRTGPDKEDSFSVSGGHATSIVGLWRVAFLVGDGPAVAFEGFQQWHAGGTEVMVDNGVPPSLGNVCLGVWKRTGPRSFSLRHVTFNWDANGQSTGTFQVVIHVRLDPSGRTYAGSFVSDSFDLLGNPIPELHSEGRLRGVRITVDQH